MNPSNERQSEPPISVPGHDGPSPTAPTISPSPSPAVAELAPHAKLDPIASFAASVERAVTRAGEFLNGFADWLGRGLVALEPVLLQLGDLVEAWFTSSMDATLRRYHWWYLPVMPRSLVTEVAQMAERGEGRRVSARICEYYRANRHKALRQLVRSWDDVPYFAARKKIFEACVRAHTRKEYVLSVPALLPHIEGIALEFLQDLGLVKKGTMNTGKWEQLLATLRPPESKAQGIMTDNLGDALLETFYSRYYPGEEYTGTVLNRHAILHGCFLNYSKEAHSLRSFLVLGTLHYFLRELLAKRSLEQIKSDHAEAAPPSAAANTVAPTRKKNRATTPKP